MLGLTNCWSGRQPCAECAYPAVPESVSSAAGAGGQVDRRQASSTSSAPVFPRAVAVSLSLPRILLLSLSPSLSLSRILSLSLSLPRILRRRLCFYRAPVGTTRAAAAAAWANLNSFAAAAADMRTSPSSERNELDERHTPTIPVGTCLPLSRCTFAF